MIFAILEFVNFIYPGILKDGARIGNVDETSVDA